MMDLSSKAVAHELTEWFQSVLRLVETSLFNIAPEGPLRDAVVLDTLRRNARILYEAKLEPDGKLYSQLCFFLAAACRQLRTGLSAGHWQAAVDSVIDEKGRLRTSASASVAVGLEFGTPAMVFKLPFDEAIRQAGLIDGVTFLSKEDREVALGLAINWGMRLLLAYAIETPRQAQFSGRKDLAWLAERVEAAAAIV